MRRIGVDKKGLLIKITRTIAIPMVTPPALREPLDTSVKCINGCSALRFVLAL
jgi:hypothetical protein